MSIDATAIDPEPVTQSLSPKVTSETVKQEQAVPDASPEESALVKAIRAVRSKTTPILPNTCLCSLPGKTTTSAAVDKNLNTIALAVDHHHCIDVCNFKDFRKGKDATYDEKRIRMRGHSSTICDLSFVPESSFLLSSSTDCTIRLWDISRDAESHQKAVYNGHMYPVWSISVSPFALYFASASADTTAKLWTTDRLFPIRVFTSHTSDVNCVRFHPNCNYIATASADRSVRLWSVTDSKCIRMFVGHRTSVHTLSFSPDGQYLASAGDDHTIKVWDLRTSCLIKEMRECHAATIKDLQWNSAASLLISSSLDQHLKVWDMTTGTQSVSKNVTGTEKQNKNPVTQSITTPLADIDTKHRVIRSQFSSHNVLFAFGLTCE